MSAQVLARIWRPRSFKDMVGQEHITRTLMNALRLERLHHAYLFCGTRGVGKTTIARILAKSFFCQQRKNSEPCNSCFSCQAIDEGSYADLIEVDAASRTKVEDTRDLLSDAQFAPTEGKYKIYLIDEVHMLSGHSFNALLKTLEEPPSHIIFLFATTEPQKLPMTMISRCLRFNLKMITEPVIVARLQEILKAEEISFEDKAIELLAHYARGSMRDALSLVDQAIAYCEKDILHDKVASMLGTAQLLSPEEAVDHLIHNRVDELLQATATMEENGVDFSEFLDHLMALLQDIAVSRLRSSNSQSEEKSSYVKDLNPEEVQLFYQIALLTKKELPWAPSPRRAVDMGLLRMFSMQPLFADEKLIPVHSRHSRAELSHEEEPIRENKQQKTEVTENEKNEKDEENEKPKEELELTVSDSSQGSTDLLKGEAPMKEGQKSGEAEEINKEIEMETEKGDSGKKEEKTEEPLEAEMKDEAKEESKEERKEAQETKEKAKEESKEEEETQETKEEARKESKEEEQEPQETKETEEAEKTKQNEHLQEPKKGEATEDLAMTEGEKAPMETAQEEEKAEAAKELSSTNKESTQEQQAKTSSNQLEEAEKDYTQPYHWAQLVESLDLSGLQASLLSDTRLVNQQKGMWLLRIPAHVRVNLENNSREAIEQALTQKLRQSIKLDIEVGAVDDTPSMLRNEQRLQMVRQLSDSPLVKNIVENYDGELDEDSVRQKDASH